MRYIATIAMLVTVILQIAIFQVTGDYAQATEAGTIALVLAFLVTAVAIGMHEAWTKARGGLG